MDSKSAFRRGEAARLSGARQRVFDWDKAAKILVERLPSEAIAGLSLDLEWTAGRIWVDGGPHLDDYTFLSSNWATPVLVIDGEEIECWSLEDERGFDSGTKWPESALSIVSESRK